VRKKKVGIRVCPVWKKERGQPADHYHSSVIRQTSVVSGGIFGVVWEDARSVGKPVVGKTGAA